MSRSRSLRVLLALLTLGSLHLASAHPVFAHDGDLRDDLRDHDSSRSIATPNGPAALYRRFGPSVFVVRTRTGHGTGFLVDHERGLVVTNHHVIESGYDFSDRGLRQVQLVRAERGAGGFLRPSEEQIPAEVVARDARRDLALLQIEGEPEWLESLEPLSLESSFAAPGSPVVMLGHPSSGMLWSLRDGLVSAAGYDPTDFVDTALSRHVAYPDQVSAPPASDDPVHILLSTCGANPGDSGGPLFDLQGRVVGVTFAIPGTMRDDKFTYHVHADELRVFLADRSEPPRVDPPRPWLAEANSGWSRESRGDVLLMQGMDQQAQFLDLDRDSERGELDGLDSLVPGIDGGSPPDAEPSFDFEMAVLQTPVMRASYYDTDGDRRFDLVLVDHDLDPTADTEFRLVDGEWTVTLDCGGEWFQPDLVEVEDKPASAQKSPRSGDSSKNRALSNVRGA